MTDKERAALFEAWAFEDEEKLKEAQKKHGNYQPWTAPEEMYYEMGYETGAKRGHDHGRAEAEAWWVEHWNKFCSAWDTCGDDDRAVLYLRIEMDARAKEGLK